jgi:hypothetical protein
MSACRTPASTRKDDDLDMPFARRRHTRCICLVLALASAACSESTFPVAPTPTASTPLVSLQTASYQGSILGGNGQVAFFDMTLIARSLGVTFEPAAQAPGTTIVSGLFKTGTGVEGTVEGTVTGALHDGTVRLTLAVVHDGCTEQRVYTGIVTGSGVALTPAEWTQSCPTNTLTFAVQAAVTTSPACSYSVSPTTVTISGNGGTRTVAVTTGADCPWVTETTVPWLSVASAAALTGTGSVEIAVQANTGAARTGVARVAGQTVNVNQGPQCSIAIAPTSTRVSAAGATVTIAVTAPDGCPWLAEARDPWLNVTPRSGEGSASVQVVVAANSGTQRQGTIDIGGLVFTVSQDAAAPCVFTIAPTSGSIGTFGGTGTVAVTTRTDCTWSVDVGAATWLQVSPVSGAGSGVVAYNAGPNLGPSRSATIAIAGQPFTVVQSGNVVTISVNLTTSSGNQPTAGTVETITSGKPDGRISCTEFVDRPQTGTCTATIMINAPTQVTFLATPDGDYSAFVRWPAGCKDGLPFESSQCSLTIDNGGTYPPMEVEFVYYFNPGVIGAANPNRK